MNASTPLSTRIILIVIVAVVLIGGIIFILANSIPGNVASPDAVYVGVIPYENINKYDGMLVTVSGYIIIPTTSKSCLSVGWTTCRLWFDDDPYREGFGLHEILLPLGTGSNSVTADGKLYNNSGELLKMKVTEQFNWYHVSINGRVSSCKDDQCLIIGDRVQGLK